MTVEKWFQPFPLTKAERENLEKLTKKAKREILGVFELLGLDFYAGALDTKKYYEEYAAFSISLLISEAMDSRVFFGNETALELIDDYLVSFSEDVVRVTFNRLGSESTYWLSEERAENAAENLVTTVYTIDRHYEAVSEGKTRHVWNAICDEKTRPWHFEVSGLDVPIDEPFEVNGELMMYPRDTSLGASEDNVLNCRCFETFL